MILIWNRKEVFVRCSLQNFNEIRYTLSSNGIKHKYKVVDINSANYFGLSNGAITGTFGINMDYTKTYYIYVHRDDYDNAQSLLRN